MIKCALVIAVLLALCSCALNPFVLKDYPPQLGCEQTTVPPNPDCKQATVEIQFLGVDGFLVRRGEDSFITGPMYSNPYLLEVGSQKIHTDTLLIDALLPDVTKVSAIFVGHSHYDHLMDVPYIADRYASNATIYGSATTKHILMGDRGVSSSGAKSLYDTPDRVQVVDPVAYRWTPAPQGSVQWTAVKNASGQRTNMRFLAIESEHSPVFNPRVLSQVKLFGLIPLRLPAPVKGEKYTPWRGTLDHDLTELPETAAEWVMGPVFAYLIDFLGSDSKPVFRVYFQDSQARNPRGSIPRGLIDGKSVDVAILCVGGARYVRGAPQAIMENTRASYFLLGHWDDLFVPQAAPLPGTSCPVPAHYREFPTEDTGGFLGVVKGELAHLKESGVKSGFCVPYPCARLFFNDSGQRLGAGREYCQSTAE
ncbi:MAG TPA: hypothetical protein VN461_04870 [Vicinamibacteria bacterium]|jgi:hypothetical protein|nr:hypothetical protein [Vicinamibacteria bacterium]